MKEKLDSERLNYLIWRYLIEGNYRETALKFQKEWHIEAPHRQLEFARYVKSHALVNVINKGLKFDSLERDFAQSQLAPNAAAEAEAMQLGVFGPVGHDVPPQQDAEEHEQSQDEDAPGDEDEEPLPPVVDAENARKRPSDRPQQPQLNGGSPAKRPRLSNGYENGAHAATADPMDLDGQNHHHGTENNHAYPSPLEGEQAPTPTLRTDGPDQATQIEKVEELASKTVFIPLGSGDASVLSPPTTSPKLASENASILLHCQWNPRDPSILAGAGSEALARVWTVSRATAALAGQDPASHGHVPDGDVSPPFHSLVEGDVSSKATVTAMAWNNDGTALAVATDGDLKGRISLWNADGTHITHFEVPESPVYKLRWSPNNAAILGINPDKNDMLVTVYPAETSTTVSFPVPGYALDNEPLDAAWTSDDEFLLAGGELLSLMQCSGTSITVVKKFETRAGDRISHVRYNETARLAATCGQKGFVDIWDASGKFREIQAHDGQVTTLAWQPGVIHAADDAALLASGGVDGAIFIWNARSMDGKPKCSMTMDSPIVALAFTPDGAFIAGATCEKILIWKVGEHNIPRASWSRRPHPGWLSPQVNNEKDQYEHCLCWDATGQKLAYGANSRLAVINFR